MKLFAKKNSGWKTEDFPVFRFFTNKPHHPKKQYCNLPLLLFSEKVLKKM